MIEEEQGRPVTKKKWRGVHGELVGWWLETVHTDEAKTDEAK
jgi:hypothetical protein